MSDTTILQNNNHVIKPKKSVALSGVPAGNTALCTVEKAVTICTIAVTTFSIWRSTANLKKSRIY
ncbi:2-methylcitrate synthase [Salmonella enterica subsp. enterica]|uniref:2-methylcitrate synthase n=1 Tax=Salmonella enterica I TaxID=59201 RepID=A0A379WZ70_SALET|nr:2-methylcitrate synthase [Salmonella enterica subsp. enterica]